MKPWIAAFSLVSAPAWGQAVQTVPPRVVSAKTIIARVYYPNGTVADTNGVQHDAEHFLKKWKRYAIVQELDRADIGVVVVVEPMTVQPNFWQRVAWGIAASQTGTHCNGQVIGDQVQANCYTSPVPAPLMPSTVFSGSILVYDAADLRAMIATPGSPMPQPIMVAFANEHGGSAPLIGAGKELRKMIDRAAKP